MRSAGLCLLFVHPTTASVQQGCVPANLVRSGRHFFAQSLGEGRQLIVLPFIKRRSGACCTCFGIIRVVCVALVLLNGIPAEVSKATVIKPSCLNILCHHMKTSPLCSCAQGPCPWLAAACFPLRGMTWKRPISFDWLQGTPICSSIGCIVTVIQGPPLHAFRLFACTDTGSGRVGGR